MKKLVLISLIAASHCFGVGAFCLEHPETELNQVGVSPVLGQQVNLDTQFLSADGRAATLREFMVDSRPVVIVPAYYHCPRLCGLVLDGVTELLKELPLQIGRDFSVLTVSIDSKETPELALKRRTRYVERLSAIPSASTGWHFLVGEENSVKPLMDQIGFHYRRDGDEFAHSAAIIVLTPEGKISQYFTGVSFPVWDVKLALVDASQGAVGSPIDHILLYCFRFDPLTGRYTWAAFGLMRLGGITTLLLLFGTIFVLWRRERKQVVDSIGSGS